MWAKFKIIEGSEAPKRGYTSRLVIDLECADPFGDNVEPVVKISYDGDGFDLPEPIGQIPLIELLEETLRDNSVSGGEKANAEDPEYRLYLALIEAFKRWRNGRDRLGRKMTEIPREGTSSYLISGHLDART